MNALENHPIAVTSDSFAVDVLDASRREVVLVDFWAAWCGPCKALAGPLNEIAAERAGQVIVAKIDVDAHPGLAARYHIRSIPSLVLFRDGEVVEMIVGLHSKAEIHKRLDVVVEDTRVGGQAAHSQASNS